MYHNLTRSCGRKVPDETLRQMLNCAIRHNRCFQFGGGVLHTKHHYWIHLIHQSKILGNPRLRSTMPNESLNGVVANVGKTCHRATFTVSVFFLEHGCYLRYCSAHRNLFGAGYQKTLLSDTWILHVYHVQFVVESCNLQIMC